MNTFTNVVRLRQPEEFEDPLTDILRSGARRLLAQAVELEAEAFLARMQDLKLPDGRAALLIGTSTTAAPGTLHQLELVLCSTKASGAIRRSSTTIHPASSLRSSSAYRC